MIPITSTQNPVIKEIKLLRERKYREEKKLFFIEGIRFVEEALKDKADIQKVLVSDRIESVKGGSSILTRVKRGNYDIYIVPDKLFRDISDTDTPQGIMAVVKASNYAIEEIYDKSFFVILDSIQDPGNMGTIIRTADAAGVGGIILSKGCVDIYNPKVLRSTMGSIFHIPVVNTNSLENTIEKLKVKGVKVFAAHLDGTSNYFEVDYKADTAIIIGNEANGISDAVAQCADTLVKIPMPGKSESLNASVAASILMYEVVRQRLGR